MLKKLIPLTTMLTGILRQLVYPISRYTLGWLFLLVNRWHMISLPVNSGMSSYFGSRATWFTFSSHKSLKNGVANRRDLWRVAQLARCLEDHVQFEEACLVYDADICLKGGEKCQFIGRGRGENSLNVYRKIWDAQGSCLFEKVLFKPSNDYQRIIFFQKAIMPLLGNDFIKVPRVREIREGNRLAAVYWDHVEFAEKGCIKKKRMEAIENILRDLSRLNLENESNLGCDVFDYSSVQAYREGVDYLSRIINSKKMGVGIDDLLHVGLVDERRVISHGDLYEENYNHQGWVWDWDRCGYYPIGFDLAWAMINIIEFNTFDDILKHSCRMAEKVYSNRGRVDMVVGNVTLFLVIFYCRKFKPSRLDPVLMEAIGHLESLLERPLEL